MNENKYAEINLESAKSDTLTPTGSLSSSPDNCIKTADLLEVERLESQKK